jgi:hypothetical protein
VMTCAVRGTDSALYVIQVEDGVPATRYLPLGAC